MRKSVYFANTMDSLGGQDDIILISMRKSDLTALIQSAVDLALQGAMKKSNSENLDEIFVTNKEVILKYKISYVGLYNLRKSGSLPFCRIGKLIRYKKTDLDSIFKTR